MQLQAIQSFNLASLIDTSISLLAAFILGSIIGFERQYRQRTAGLRTNVLVAVGAAIFVDAANRLNGAVGATQVMAYVVSGIGFLGAGAIMREEGNVRGLNTAATLWGSGAIGALAGADLLAEAIMGTFFVLSANTLLRPIVNNINQRPLDTNEVEVTHILNVICAREHQKNVLSIVEQLLEEQRIATHDLQVDAFGEEDVEITATLVSSSADSNHLEKIVDNLLLEPEILQAYWNSSASS